MNTLDKPLEAIRTRALECVPFILSFLINISPFIALFFSWELYVLLYYIVLFYLTSKYIRIIIFFLVGIKRITKESKINWMSKIQKIRRKKLPTNFIVFAFANESYDILEKSISHLLNQQYDPSKIIVVLAHEAKYKSGDVISDKLIKKFKSHFLDIIDTSHVLQPDELASKSANISYSLKHLNNYINAKNYDQNNILITICDSDSLLDKTYISHLNYNFLTSKDRYTTIWSGAMVFVSNYNDVAWYIKTINILFSIMNISLTYRWREKFVPNSTFSLSLSLLKDIDYITPNIIHDDFHTFLKALYKHNDKVFCKSLNCMTISSIPNSSTRYRSFQTQYNQVKRWASGINEIAYMSRKLTQTISDKLDIKAKFYVTLRTLDKILDLQILGISGPLLAFNFLLITQLDPDFEIEPILTRHKIMIVVLTYIPFILGALTWYASDILKKNFIVSPYINDDKNKVIGFVKELTTWILYPFVTIFLTWLPALHAQYELFMNKKKQFVISDKKI